MDFDNRIILAAMLGLGVGFGLGYFFGNTMIWSIFCLAVALATQSTWPVTKPESKSRQQTKIEPTLQADQTHGLPPEKPDKPHF